jgi:hypothetical protein
LLVSQDEQPKLLLLALQFVCSLYPLPKKLFKRLAYPQKRTDFKGVFARLKGLFNDAQKDRVMGKLLQKLSFAVAVNEADVGANDVDSLWLKLCIRVIALQAFKGRSGFEPKGDGGDLASPKVNVHAIKVVLQNQGWNSPLRQVWSLLTPHFKEKVKSAEQEMTAPTCRV